MKWFTSELTQCFSFLSKNSIKNIKYVQLLRAGQKQICNPVAHLFSYIPSVLCELLCNCCRCWALTFLLVEFLSPDNICDEKLFTTLLSLINVSASLFWLVLGVLITLLISKFVVKSKVYRKRCRKSSAYILSEGQ